MDRSDLNPKQEVLNGTFHKIIKGIHLETFRKIKNKS